MLKILTAVHAYFHRNALYIWTSFWIIFIIFFGLIAIYEYTNYIDTNYSVVVIWAIAYFFLGGLFGCVLGVPKGVSKPQIEAPKNPPILVSNQPQAIEQTSQLIPTAKITYNKQNTNLTDISDWLTKIIIGAGLVQLNKIPGFVMKVAGRMAQGIHLAAIGSSQMLCAGIIIYYTCFGLIAGYFVMRSILLTLIDE